MSLTETDPRISNGFEQIPDHDFVVTPEEARAYLERLGYTDNTWDDMRRDGSHDIRANIDIARGSEAVNLNDYYHAHYPEKLAQTPSDISAATAADRAAEAGAWEKLVPLRK